jgi:glycosyltransferase involved in cell wall biosynthesis
LRFVFVNPYFPPYAPGGAEYSLEQICKCFPQKGWSVHVVTHAWDGKPRKEIFPGYTIERIPSPVIMTPGQDDEARAYVFSRRYVTDVLKALMTMDLSLPTALIANNAQSYLPVVLAGRYLKLPTVGIVRDVQPICETGACIDNQKAEIAVPCQGIPRAILCQIASHVASGKPLGRLLPYVILSGFRKGWRRRNLQLHGLTRFDRIVVISHALQSLIGRIAYVSKSKISVIRNFYTHEEPAAPQEVEGFLKLHSLQVKEFFLVAGKKSYGKGSDIAVAAVDRLRHIKANMRVLFVGKGQLMNNLSDSYVDAPSVSPSLLLALLQASAGLLVPGRWQEGLHRTMIDALKYGIPIVCSEAGGVKEGVVVGQNGYVFPCGDVEACSENLRSVIQWSDVQKDACINTSSMLFNEQFSDDRILGQWEMLFKELLIRN